MGRMTLGLYNTYAGVRFREPHRRTLARAAPVALAYDCNLVTFGFPFPRDLKTPLEIAEFVASTTSIGEGGAYLINLAREGRFTNFEFPKRGFPPQLGEIVATTRRPYRECATSADQVGHMLISGRSICLVFGLGPSGLPNRVLDMAKSHLDITSRSISLETCTAIGIVPAVISTTSERIAGDFVTYRPIGVIHTPFRTPDECPKFHDADAEGTVVVRPEFACSLHWLERYDKVILIYHHHVYRQIPQRPVNTHDEERGESACTSSRRLNPLGISVVEVISVDLPRLTIRGINVADGTLLLDIKPHLK